jgi:hypothetical protein
LDSAVLADTQTMILAFSKGKGLVGAAIRWFTWSRYAHVAAVLPEGVIEAMPFKGVIKHDFWSDTSHLDFFIVTGPYENRRAAAYLNANIGRQYDWLGVLRFLPRWRKSNDRVFCSELIFSALRFAGIELLRGVPPEKVSPGLLACSPYLHPISVSSVFSQYPKLNNEE